MKGEAKGTWTLGVGYAHHFLYTVEVVMDDDGIGQESVRGGRLEIWVALKRFTRLDVDRADVIQVPPAHELVPFAVYVEGLVNRENEGRTRELYFKKERR